MNQELLEKALISLLETEGQDVLNPHWRNMNIKFIAARRRQLMPIIRVTVEECAARCDALAEIGGGADFRIAAGEIRALLASD